MRNSIKSLWLLIAITTFVSCSQIREIKKESSEKSKPFIFATWASGDTGRTDMQWDSVFTKFHNAGITDFFILASPKELKRMVRLTKDKGIRIHGWVLTLERPGDTVAQKHPDWYSVNREGKNSLEYNPYIESYQWLSPFSKGARGHIKKNIEAIAEVKGIASVHLDYVRYCDVFLPSELQPKYHLVQDHQMPEYDFDYLPEARKEFKKIFGVDPMEMAHPELSNEWLQFRLNAVTSLVNELADIAHEHNTKISAAVFPFPELARHNVRQDWSSWNLDLAVPMLYQNYYNENINWIGFSIAQGVREVHGRFPIYAGLMVSTLSPKELKEAILISKKNGAAGVSFFMMGSLTDEDLTVIKQLNDEFIANQKLLPKK
ncbi:MAG: family 10 glycosylhydrolase [Ignavibacteriaceae bacterium]